MSKELPYFRFYVAEWQNGDITLEDDVVQGVFVNICCYYWKQGCSLAQAKLKLRFKHCLDDVEKLLVSKIIKVDKRSDKISIEFLDEQYEMLLELHGKRVEAGRKGGKQSSSPAQAKLKPNPSYKDKDKDKDEGGEKKGKKSKKFKPPTVEDVIEYLKKKDWTGKINPKSFVAHYETVGWMRNGTKIKDWKACVRTWVYRDKDPNGSKDPFESVPL